jgi:hypothetical protein
MHRQHIRECGRSLWPVIVFLSLFLVSLLTVWRQYFTPAMKAYATANDAQRRVLRVNALLVMCVLLFVLGALLLVLTRVHTWFSRGTRQPPSKTIYTDAWAEAGRRMREKNLDE